jgi:polysaccharide pyruvyl transferase WcaK-like protein
MAKLCRKIFKWCKRRDNLTSYKKDIKSCVWGNFGFKICHAYAQNYNFGDNALAYGVKNAFLKYFSNVARFEDIDVHSTVFDKHVIKKINNTYDLFLIGGGGLIHTVEKEFWLFNMANRDISRVRIPMVFFGLGYNNFQGKPLHPRAIDNVKLLQRAAVSFSIRNDGSVGRLRESGLDFAEVPDPGFFVDGNHPKPDIKGDYVILQLANDAPELRNVNQEFVDNIVKICKTLVRKKYTVVLAPHCYPDIWISNEVVSKCNSKKVVSWDWCHFIRKDCVAEGLGYYKYAKFVLAMRGHAQICPMGMNVPVISMINHPKHLGSSRGLL